MAAQFFSTATTTTVMAMEPISIINKNRVDKDYWRTEKLFIDLRVDYQMIFTQ